MSAMNCATTDAMKDDCRQTLFNSGASAMPSEKPAKRAASAA
jgi:hypothetical protein